MSKIGNAMAKQHAIKNNIIACAAGVSGGHIIPCLTLAHDKHRPDTPRILFFCARTALDARILHEYPTVQQIPLIFHGAHYTIWWRLPYTCTLFLISLIQSVWHLWRMRPLHLITTGGAVSIAPCIAARLLHIPIELYELNAIPGRASHVISTIATTIVVCFKNTQRFFDPTRCIYQPYPLRTAIKNIVHEPKKAHAATTILVLGGSQGSFYINDLIVTWVKERLHDAMRIPLHIIHQTGMSDNSKNYASYMTHGIRATVFPFSQSIEDYYQKADIIICRAGAGTLFEAIALNKRCIVIPLETYQTAHQLDNARALAHEYPALITVLRQEEINNDIKIFFNVLHAHITTPTPTHAQQITLT